MKALKNVFLFLLLIFLVSCAKEGECYDSHKKLMEMKSYTANAEITIHGNKSSSKYKVKQLVDEYGNIKIETKEPKELAGKKVIYENKKWKVYHPLIQEVVEFEALRDIDEVMYMGLIQKKFLMSEDLKEKRVTKNEQKCIEFKGTLPNSNEHRNYAKLYVNEESLDPVALEIYNKDDKVTLEVKYTDFKYNPQINKEEFKVKK